jgi:NAD(P)-dependent dehydrogenase (short-subunit alcohol dehydrogenase family)
MGQTDYLSGGIAVLTGAASGIGFALAKKARSQGMHVVISDIRQSKLDEAVARLKSAGDSRLEVLGLVCDVTNLLSVEKLRDSIFASFKNTPIQFLAANAGVLFPKSTVLTGTTEEWRLTYEVNVIGVQHTLKTFVPAMMRQSQKSIVEITASSAGVMFGGTGPYGTSKLAALGIAEALYKELQLEERAGNGKISIVTLCPAIVTTELLDSSSSGSVSNIKGMAANKEDAASELTTGAFKAMWQLGMTADYCADQVFEHAADGKFYCILDNDQERDGMTIGLDERITARYQNFMERSPPSPRSSVAVEAVLEEDTAKAKASTKSRL